MLTCHRAIVGLLVITAIALPGRASPSVQVGVATPMQKVMIEGQQKGWPFQSQYEGWLATSYSLSLARNEHEAFQVVVISDQDLTSVRASVSSLEPRGGQGPFNGEVGAWLVGYVKCSEQPRSDLDIQYPPYLVDYKGGWWPDPLLTFTNTCNVKANDRVAFWINVSTSDNTPAGEYAATVTIEADGIDPIPVQLSVQVWDFALPARPTLPTAFSIDSLWQAKWVYGDNNWTNELRNKFYQMHQAHRLSVTEIYNAHPQSTTWFEPLLALNNAFCISKVPTKDPNGLITIRQYFEGLGRLNEAYVYGYDEASSDKFQEMYNTFSAIHADHPGLRTMTTAYDSSYGTAPNSYFLRDAVDIWVPTTTSYNAAAAASLRAEGKDVWWYIAEGPRHPYANWYVQYPAIEARLLMGAMTFKYDAHGFLYYAVTNWGYNVYPTLPKNKPITSGPYTNWSPIVAYSSKYSGWIDGDGSLYCAGPVEVGPLPTIRLENIRDGLEDYEYLTRLKEIVGLIGRCPPSDPAAQTFLQTATALLAVPSGVVSTVGAYTRDPAVLYGYRTQLAEKIIQGQQLLAGISVPSDSDGDGVGDPCDNCPDTSNPDQGNSDGDQQGNACDPDDDNDDAADADDNCPLIPNSGQEDGDSDLVGNVCDNCPGSANPEQKDTDRDGVGDACDNCGYTPNRDQADGDQDGVGNLCDNCPDTANASQADDDEDGLGDACDPTPFGGKRLDEEFDGMQTGAQKIGSWDQGSMLARWPLTYSYNGAPGGSFVAGKGLDPAGAAMDTKKTSYRMTANLEPDMTATYGEGNGGIGAGSVLLGTDDKPLTIEFSVDFRGEAYGQNSNFYVELSYDSGDAADQAPRQGMTTEDTNLGNGDQGPWRADRVYSALAFGTFSAVNRAPNDVEGAGGMGAACFFDGLRWHYTKYLADVHGQLLNLWKSSYGGVTHFKMVITTQTVTLSLTNPNGNPASCGPYTVARLYTGGFNRLSLTMGNPLKSAAKYSYVDNIEVRNGLIAAPAVPGACCIGQGDGTGSCQVVTPDECAGLQGMYMGPEAVCGENNETCDFCPSDPEKRSAGQCGCGVADVDSDLDQTADCIDACDSDSWKTEAGFCGCGAPETDRDSDGMPDCVDDCTMLIATDVESVNVPEGGTATFQVKLTCPPSSVRTVNVERMPLGDPDIRVSSPVSESLTFTPDNWDVYQTVTLSALEDDNTVNGTAAIRCRSEGLVDATVTAAEVENDTLSIVTSELQVTVPEGQSASFGVKLNLRPLANVTVHIAKAAGGDANLTVLPETLVFTTANWNTFRTVTVSAAEDADAANGKATIRCSALELETREVVATEQDNDTQSILTDTSSLSVPEGGTGSFKVRLTVQPIENVTVHITKVGGGDADLSASPATLTFTGDNWNSYQTVTVSAAKDADAVSGQAVIRCSAAGLASVDVAASEVEQGLPATTWYRDRDADGYGNAAEPQQAFDQPAGYVSDNTDCNDTKESIHPGATDIPDDGIDQDCNGSDATTVPPASADADADGVPDASDLCPATAAGATVDAQGCAAAQLDTDADGVKDDQDECAQTPAGTVVGADGCPVPPVDTDADDDGVADADDECPNTAAGAGVDAQGCASAQRDTDGDGVTDDADQCADTPAGTSVQDDGCPPDEPGDDEPSDGEQPRPRPFPFCGAGVVQGLFAITAGLALLQARRRRG